MPDLGINVNVKTCWEVYMVKKASTYFRSHIKPKNKNKKKSTSSHQKKKPQLFKKEHIKIFLSNMLSALTLLLLLSQVRSPTLAQVKEYRSQLRFISLCFVHESANKSCERDAYYTESTEVWVDGALKSCFVPHRDIPKFSSLNNPGRLKEWVT